MKRKGSRFWPSRCVQTISAPITYAEREIFLTASIGIARHDPASRLSAEELLKTAEIAVVHAKRLGGDQVERFDPAMRQTTRGDRLGLESDLRRALDRGEIRVAFQPIVRLEDRTIAGSRRSCAGTTRGSVRSGRRPSSRSRRKRASSSTLGLFALERTARELAAWQRALEVEPPIFASVKRCRAASS